MRPIWCIVERFALPNGLADDGSQSFRHLEVVFTDGILEVLGGLETALGSGSAAHVPHDGENMKMDKTRLLYNIRKTSPTILTSYSDRGCASASVWQEAPFQLVDDPLPAMAW